MLKSYREERHIPVDPFNRQKVLTLENPEKLQAQFEQERAAEREKVAVEQFELKAEA